jgi:hypothetical protein
MYIIIFLFLKLFSYRLFSKTLKFGSINYFLKFLDVCETQSLIFRKEHNYKCLKTKFWTDEVSRQFTI